MCGIVGMVSTLTTKHWQLRETWLKKALYVDTLRGKDSTGIACVPHDLEEEVIVHKKAMGGSDFLDLVTTQKLLFAVDKYRCVIGHNRAATAGEVTNTNAHPFTVGNITLVHNGTMDYWTGLDKSYDVDSEAICAALNKYETKSVLEKLAGAFALVWHDATDGSIHFARNDQRPFHFAFSKDNATMLFASEAWMIENLCPVTIKLGSVFSLVAGKHVSIDSTLEDLSKYKVEDFIPLPSETDLWNGWYSKSKGKADRPQLPAPQQNTGGKGEGVKLLESLGYVVGKPIQFWAESFIPYHSGDRGTLRGSTYAGSTNVGVQDKVVAYGTFEILSQGNYLLEGIPYSAERRDNRYSIMIKDVDWANVTDEDTADGEKEGNTYEIKILNSRGDNITKKEFELLAKHGCALCTGDVEAEDSEFIEWTQDGHPLCLECTNEMEKKAEDG